MEAFATSDPGFHADALISGCLDCLDGRVTKAGPTSWRLTLPGEGKAPTTFTLHPNWIVVERTLSGCRVTRRARTTTKAWRLLDPKLPLPSGARAVLPAGETKARIRAERPLLQTPREDPAALVWWINLACADAASCDGGAQTTASRFDSESVQEPSGTTQVNVSELCSLAGWSVTPRIGSDDVVVALPARDGGVCHALATLEGSAVRFRVDLGIVGDAATTPACQAAMVVTLLRTAGSVRLVRSTAACNDGRVSAALQVCVPIPVSSESLNQALPALAFAHQQVAKELDALARDDALAHTYLALQRTARGMQEKPGTGLP